MSLSISRKYAHGFFEFLVLVLLQELNDEVCWRLFRNIIPFFENEKREYMASKVLLLDSSNIANHHRNERFQCQLILMSDLSPIQFKPDTSQWIVTSNGYRSLTIGDLAAIKLAEELDRDIPWIIDRTPAEWSKVRDEVRALAEKELAMKGK